MNNSQRGVIQNRKFATQIRDFRGLRYGKITPTDIDGFIDFGNKVFVIIEVKYSESNNFSIPYGQLLAIERLVDNLNGSGKKVIAIIARHTTDGDIDVANCIVSKVRYNGVGRWIEESGTVKQLIDRFLLKYAPEYLEDKNK